MTGEKQEGQKTIVAFIVGLLIGGLLVWAFSSPNAVEPINNTDDETTEMQDSDNDEDTNVITDETDEEENNDDSSPTLEVGEGNITVNDQPAGTRVALSSATYPISEGWIGVRDYQNEQLGGLLGVARFSEEQGLVPNEIFLQRGTEAGRHYAVVVYSESGDRSFSLADDVQIDSVFATFVAK